jgi:hypothetical protein
VKPLAILLLVAGCANVRIIDTRAAARSFTRLAVPTASTRGRNEFQLLHDGCASAATALGKTVVETFDSPDLIVSFTYAYDNTELGSVGSLLATLVDPFAGTIVRAVELDSPSASINARDAGYQACRGLIEGNKK